MSPVAQVELDSLLEAGAASIASGVAVTLTFALAVRGWIAATERHRDGDRVLAALAGAMGALALLVGLGVVIAGLLIVAGS